MYIRTIATQTFDEYTLDYYQLFYDPLYFIQCSMNFAASNFRDSINVYRTICNKSQLFIPLTICNKWTISLDSHYYQKCVITIKESTALKVQEKVQNQFKLFKTNPRLEAQCSTYALSSLAVSWSFSPVKNNFHY